LTVFGARQHAGAMSPSAAPAPKKKPPLLKLGIVVVVLAVAAILVLKGMDLRGLADRFMSEIRSRGPWVFFTGLAILPVFGMPVLAFGLTAGPAFSRQLGMPLVVFCVLVAVTINFLLSYALARRALRPVLEKLMTRFGYKLPQVEAGDSTDLVMILRLTPGIPFFVQNYLCGLAEVKFSKYVVMSCLIVWPMNAAAVVFSDALFSGKGRMAITAGMLLVAVAAATHLARKHYAKKQKPPAP
jgi:uncharacterized membrane protein YdjX (TVP38/TMEM64 family)